jgi:hypothetical protein
MKTPKKVFVKGLGTDPDTLEYARQAKTAGGEKLFITFNTMRDLAIIVGRMAVNGNGPFLSIVKENGDRAYRNAMWMLTGLEQDELLGLTENTDVTYVHTDAGMEIALEKFAKTDFSMQVVKDTDFEIEHLGFSMSAGGFEARITWYPEPPTMSDAILRRKRKSSAVLRTVSISELNLQRVYASQMGGGSASAGSVRLINREKMDIARNYVKRHGDEACLVRFDNSVAEAVKGDRTIYMHISAGTYPALGDFLKRMHSGLIGTAENVAAINPNVNLHYH